MRKEQIGTITIGSEEISTTRPILFHRINRSWGLRLEDEVINRILAG